MDDGSEITKDQEFLGTWEADENDHPSFMPDGASEPLFFEMWTGLLCAKIEEWRKESEWAEFVLGAPNQQHRSAIRPLWSKLSVTCVCEK